jgi:putative transposase
VILAALAEAQDAGARLEPACEIVGVPPRTIQRWRANPGADDRRSGPRHRAHNAFTPAQEARVVKVLTDVRHAGVSPKQLVPRLADEGLFVASESTMYRVQRRHGLRRTKRPVASRDVARATTMHTATGPNQVWSWDITLLPTTVRGDFLYLYLVMDVWSRRIVGWTVEDREAGELASRLARRLCAEQAIPAGTLVLHADNGSAMRANTMLATLQRLGVVPSFSRPHVSNDNPYSEALFRTLKHGHSHPRFPFAALADARRWVARFVVWYNTEHRHSGIRFVTPDDRHFGRELEILARRHALYQMARRAHPERWTGNTRNWAPVGHVTLNPEPDVKAAA